MLTIREVEVVNQALQCLGTRTTVTWDELQNNSTNEAIQANIILRPLPGCYASNGPLELRPSLY